MMRDLRYALPAEGVYALNGQGTERISFPPNSHPDGAVMPATITYLADGCWRWHIDYNVAHWEEYDFCPRGGRLLLKAGNRVPPNRGTSVPSRSTIWRGSHVRPPAWSSPMARSPVRRSGPRARAPTRPCPGEASLRQPYASSELTPCGSGKNGRPHCP